MEENLSLDFLCVERGQFSNKKKQQAVFLMVNRDDYQLFFSFRGVR